VKLGKRDSAGGQKILVEQTALAGKFYHKLQANIWHRSLLIAVTAKRRFHAD
jgi:hypothetical protein